MRKQFDLSPAADRIEIDTLSRRIVRARQVKRHRSFLL
jgi:hypothetical protein